MAGKSDEVTRVVEPPSSETRADATSEDTPHDSAPELPEGATFDRYVVVRKLGSGGMGVVYLAYDPELDRGVALKVLRPGAHSSDRGAAQARLLREAKVMARLSHPNVLPVYDAGAVDSRVFVAMEHVDGGTLGKWLKSAEHDWSEILDIFIAAGRGLSAAHAAGLVHRDFKPENVMLDRDGRARVMDFGLARTAWDEEDPLSSDERDSSLSSMRAASGPYASVPSAALSASLSASVAASASGSFSGQVSGVDILTRTGFVLGTPAYMAPEQHFGEAPDPASDQFSFCVALFEGLFGTRPFHGKDANALCKAATEGQIAAPPAHSNVPGWLRRVVLRGLAPTPQERWPSMDALLAAIARHRRGVQHRRTAVRGLALVGVVVGGGAWWQAQRDAPCEGSEAALVQAWDDEQRDEIRASFATTELSFAGEAAQRSIDAIDAWGIQWVQEHRSACEATHVRHEQSDTALDLRMRCLAGQRDALRGLTSVLATAEQSTVERASSAVEQLPAPARCTDLEALAAEVAPPEDPALRASVDREIAAIANVDALLAAARFAEARETFDGIAERAAQLSYPPLHVRVNARQSRLLDAEGELDEAIGLLVTTTWQAEALGMDRMTLQLASYLVSMQGAERHEHERGRRWAALAKAKLERVGNPPQLRGKLLRRLGDLADAEGNYDEAAEYFREALELRAEHQPGTVVHALALADFGKTHFRAARYAEAAEVFDNAADLLVDVLGPNHPEVGKIRGNAGTAHHATGDYAKARATFEVSLAVMEAAYGPDHLAVSTTLANLGNVHYRVGDYDQAIELGRRSIAIKEAKLGKGHPKTGLSLNNVAMALSKQDKHEEALATYRQAAEALTSLGPEHIAQVEPQLGVGEQLMHLGRAAESIAPLRRAYDLEKAHGHAPTRAALPAFLLARALWDGGGDRTEARALATEGLRALGEPKTLEDEHLADALKKWQREHGTHTDVAVATGDPD